MADSSHLSRSVWWVNPTYLCREKPFEGAVQVVGIEGWRDTPMGEFVTPILGAKLDAMEASEPRTFWAGYEEAIIELREWMEHGDA